MSLAPANPEFTSSALIPVSCRQFGERDCLNAYTRQRLYRGEIHHLPWDLQEATADIEQNTMAGTLGIQLPSHPDLAYFSRELKVLLWAPERLL